MTQIEFDTIVLYHSQILDDIGNNPDWHECACAVAEEFGTLEKKMKEMVNKPKKGL